MKINLIDLSNLQNEAAATAAINNNNTTIENAIENSISRDGTQPNQMNSNLDMNSNKILNLPDALTDQEPVTYGQFMDGITSVANGSVIDGTYITVSANDTLVNERVLTAGPNISLIDGGAGGNYVVSVSSAELNSIASAGSAADKLPYYTGTGTASTTDFTSFARTLLDDADAATARATLGVSVGTGDLQAVNNLSDVSNTTTALTNLGGLKASNNLSDVVNATTSLTNLGGLKASNNLSDVSSAATSRSNLQVGVKGYLYGLTLSTAGSSSTFGITAGECLDSTGVNLMSLGSAYTKTTSAWAVGTANGSLDTGSIANSTWYHVYIIKRTDTGVVDVLTSTSATSPTLPTNYTLSRRIGSMKTNGSAQWVKFVQDGDNFTWDVAVNDVSAANPGTSAVTRTLSVPSGVRVEARFFVGSVAATPSTDAPIAIYITDLSTADVVPGITASSTVEFYFPATTTTQIALGSMSTCMTNTSSQVRSRIQQSTAGTAIYMNTCGWRDTRGRFA